MQRQSGVVSHQIGASQCITSISEAIKECIENSVDANATVVEVAILEQGFEVKDNGDGIPPAHHAQIALRHYTSKLEQFQDLETTSSFGFRGEALSALAMMSQLEVVTNSGCGGHHLTFDEMGNLSTSNQIASEKGTTVKVQKLFRGLPVREQEFKLNAKREYGKAIELLQEYAVFLEGVKLAVTHKKQRLFTTSGKSMSDNITVVFGSKFRSGVQEFSFESGKFRVHGFVSVPGQGRSTSDRQYVCINQRPVLFPKLNRMMNEVWRSQYQSSYPIFMLKLQLESGTFDINVTTNKRTILLQDEAALLEWLRLHMQGYINEFGGSQKPTFKKPKIQMPEPVSVKSKPVQKIASTFGQYSKLEATVDDVRDAFAQRPQTQHHTLEVKDITDESLRVHKSDFEDMQVIGQFNLGFIMATLTTDDKTDLYVIDQHASDEKCKFEQYTRELQVSHQQLVQPRLLKLPPDELLQVQSHSELLAKNGFRVKIDGPNVWLTTLPVFNGKILQIEDFYELLQLISSDDQAKCSKVRSILASKACRSAVMIGDPLQPPQMVAIVSKMSTLNHPWNCPHGRPTIRWLSRS